MNKIFIANVATDYTSEELTELLTPFGTITSAKVVANKKPGNLSFAFVEFEEEKSARKAIKYFEEHPMAIEDGDAPLVVKEARQREERPRISMSARNNYAERRNNYAERRNNYAERRRY